MSLTINHKYQYIEYYGPTKSISQMTSLPSISSIIGINSDGIGFLSWSASSSYNSLTTLTNGQGYLIVSVSNTPNYLLYSEVDTNKNDLSKSITNNLEIARFKTTSSPKSISSIANIFFIKEIFGISDSGTSPISWSSTSSMNSLTELVDDTCYLISSNSVPYDLWSFLPASPTPTKTATQTPTPTPTLTATPTVTPSQTVTPTVTPTVTNTPSSTPLPKDTPFNISFDQQIYVIPIKENKIDNSYLISLTINGQPNTNYSYTFSSESDNATLTFDNTQGSLSLHPPTGVGPHTGKIFTNLFVQTKYGQAIVKCTVTDEESRTIDALAIVILDD